MESRRQRTIGQAAEIEGIAFFSAADVRLRLNPAPANHGLVFRRVDVPGAPGIPATIAHAVDRHRRTGIANGANGHADNLVEMTEHVLAALAGMQIDNCLVEVDSAETPGLDGSSAAIVEAIERAGIVEQDAAREVFVVTEPITVTGENGATVTAEPCERFEIVYDLDYGPDAPFAPQLLSLAITPESFTTELARARTFVLEAEVDALRARGYGARTTAADLVVFRNDGSILENELRWVDECVRHKVLDAVGDLALLGTDLHARIRATRSGHQLNRDLVRTLVARVPETDRNVRPADSNETDRIVRSTESQRRAG